MKSTPEALEYQRQYRATHVEELRAYRRQRWLDHKARLTEANRESAARWAREHRGHLAAKRSRRRALQYAAPGHHTGAEWLGTLAAWGYRCAYCGKRAALERDHVVPLSRGGGDYIENIVPACTPCNRSKKDLLVEEWRPR